MGVLVFLLAMWDTTVIHLHFHLLLLHNPIGHNPRRIVIKEGYLGILPAIAEVPNELSKC